MSEEELGRIRKRLSYAAMQLEREAKFLPASRPENRRFHRAFSAVTEVNNALANIHCAETGNTMTIRCGHCGSIHDSVADVRQCATENVGTMQDFKEIVDDITVGDPWEGATESDPGVWAPGPDWYLKERIAREANGEEFPQQGGFGGPTQDELTAKSWEERLKDISEGFYALSEDEIYMVVRSRAGRLYAKLLVGTQSGSHWEYAAGAITKLEPKMRMKLDDAKNYGKETGTCLVCGRTLTNPDSIEAGIGPVCASRF